jgi:hypothetical protein
MRTTIPLATARSRPPDRAPTSLALTTRTLGMPVSGSAATVLTTTPFQIGCGAAAVT